MRESRASEWRGRTVVLSKAAAAKEKMPLGERWDVLPEERNGELECRRN